MAADYLEEVRGCQGEGPYLLGGWSMGGFVAWEMARRLQEDGQEVALLALIDSHPLAVDGMDDGIDLDAGMAAGLFVDDLAGLSGRALSFDRERFNGLEAAQQLECLHRLAQEAGVLPENVDPGRAHGLIEVFLSNLRSLRGYRVQPYRGRVTVFQAGKPMGGTRRSREVTMDWAPVVDGLLETHIVPGNHYTMMQGAGLDMIAGCLQRWGEELFRESGR